MHQRVIEFILKTQSMYPEFFQWKRVLEFGSLNINGTPRIFFQDCEWTGVDWRAGPLVDVVKLAHMYRDPTNQGYDVVISTEMLEHDLYAKRSFQNMINNCKPGGLILVTAAGPGRVVHHTETGVSEHYANIEPNFFVKFARQFERYDIFNPVDDVQFRGIKK